MIEEDVQKAPNDKRRTLELAEGDLLLKPPTSCGQRRSHHILWKPGAGSYAASTFLRRTGSASAGVATGRCDFSRPSHSATF